MEDITFEMARQRAERLLTPVDVIEIHGKYYNRSEVEEIRDEIDAEIENEAADMTEVDEEEVEEEENFITTHNFIKECDLYREVAKIHKQYYSNPLRMGQFFCNKFSWLIDCEPTLFDEPDNQKALQIIKKYVKE